MKRPKVSIKVIGAGLLILLIAFALGRMTGARRDALKHAKHASTSAKLVKAQTWTCSMHPQIKLPKAGKCPLCGMNLIPLESSSDDEGGLRELSVSENSAKLMEIETVPVERRFVTADVRMVGKIDYDETRVSYITAWVPGRLDRLFVDYTGVPIKKGDHLVSLYSPELLSAQEELLQAIKAVKELERSDVSIVRDTTEATVTAVREKLRLWGLTPEQIKEIEQRGKANDHVTIYAPAGGIVIHKNAQEGMYVKTGTRIYTIADLSQVWVNLDAYESDLAWLRYGQQVQFTTESYPGEVFSGSISFIQPVLDEATRTIKVRVNVSNEDGRLKPGMFIRAVAEAQVATGGRVMDTALAGKWISPMHPEIVKDTAGSCDVCGMPLVRAESLGYVGSEPTDEDQPLVIPASAALLTGKRAIVYVRVPDRKKPTFEGREIVLGPRAGDYYVVKHGLVAGERVVTRGAFKLDAELQIQAKPSMMTPDGGGGGGMAGMDHGGEKAAPEEMEAMTASQLELSAIALDQLLSVAEAADKATTAALSGDLTTVRPAFATLAMALKSVNADQLSGKAALIWKEQAMLLGNDAFEGNELKSPTEAKHLAKSVGEHVINLRKKMGLKSDAPVMTMAPALDPEFKKQVGDVVKEYLSIQAAFAQDNGPEATATAQKALAVLAKVDMNLVTGKAHIDWMGHARELKSLLSAVADANGIEPARAQFALLSEQIIATLSRFGVSGEKLYKAWCPMAFDNRGASWIQDGEKIDNPYFGETMLRCGAIKEVLK